MKLSPEQKRQLKTMIEECIKQLYLNDISLIKRRGMEQSALFRFALYLDARVREIDGIEDLRLDVEYNKDGLFTKRLPRRPKGVRPDLIVHRRESNDANILVVEIKGWWNKKSRENDRIKLEDFTDQRGEYKYGLGAFLDLGKTGCTPEYFVNGSKK